NIVVGDPEVTFELNVTGLTGGSVSWTSVEISGTATIKGVAYPIPAKTFQSSANGTRISLPFTDANFKDNQAYTLDLEFDFSPTSGSPTDISMADSGTTVDDETKAKLELAFASPLPDATTKKNSRYKVKASNIVVGDPEVTFNLEITDSNDDPVTWTSVNIAAFVSIDSASNPFIGGIPLVVIPASQLEGNSQITLPFEDTYFGNNQPYELTLAFTVNPIPLADPNILLQVSGSTVDPEAPQGKAPFTKAEAKQFVESRLKKTKRTVSKRATSKRASKKK
ncbi:MAG: hypothetical protein AAF399_11820, partial [Bacteroidota bacterium]